MPCKYKQMTATTKQVLKAFRHAVETQIKNWKEKNPWTRGAKCPITDKPMTKGQSEVDHCDSSFRELVDDFLSDNEPTLDDLKEEVRFLHSQKRWLFKDSELEHYRRTFQPKVEKFNFSAYLLLPEIRFILSRILIVFRSGAQLSFAPATNIHQLCSM
jgi:hypothetical protein